MDSTTGISPELYVISEGTGTAGQRVIYDAILAGCALVPFPAYHGARVTRLETASQRRAAQLGRLNAGDARTATMAAILACGGSLTAT